MNGLLEYPEWKSYTKQFQSKLVRAIVDMPYHIVVMRTEGTLFAHVQEWPGCMTNGDTWPELGDLIEDAMIIWAETCLEDMNYVPAPYEEEE